MSFNLFLGTFFNLCGPFSFRILSGCKQYQHVMCRITTAEAGWGVYGMMVKLLKWSFSVSGPHPVTQHTFLSSRLVYHQDDPHFSKSVQLKAATLAAFSWHITHTGTSHTLCVVWCMYLSLHFPRKDTPFDSINNIDNNASKCRRSKDERVWNFLTA